jgi:drug/metabolite transporter (DMT)-like permease
VPGLTERIQAAPPQATASIIYLGIFPTAIGYITWTYALARANVSMVTSTLNLLPVLSLIIAWVWLGEIPSFVSLMGGALTLAGVVVLSSWGRVPVQRKTQQPDIPVDIQQPLSL